MKAVITVTAKDTKGIIAKVTSKMFEYGANILDISQSLVGEYFAMIMLIEMDEKEKKFLELSDALKNLEIWKTLKFRLCMRIFSTLCTEFRRGYQYD